MTLRTGHPGKGSHVRSAAPGNPSPRPRKRPPHFASTRDGDDAACFRVPPSDAMPKRVFLICHYCGYSPEGDVPRSGACPKCGGFSWERYALAEPLVPAHMK